MGGSGVDSQKAKKKLHAEPQNAPKKKKRKKTTAPENGHHTTRKPSFSVEWSRNQVLYRTGKRRPGQSAALTFAKYGSSDKAIAAAKKLVAKGMAGDA